LRKKLLLVLVGGICFLAFLLVYSLSKIPEPIPESVAHSFQLPLNGSWTLSQEFGEWNPNWCGYHLAEDVRRGSEARVYATANGVVRFAALAQLGYGYVVVIEHKLPSGEYVCTVYGHLKKENLTSLGPISKGNLVGYLSGDPEHNGGFIHLHFGIRRGKYVATVRDPRRGGWYYGGYTTILGECNREDPIHQQILTEWLNPTTDPTNGEGFVDSHA
jgi:murein DD-endopeptidase MepM/ murein hydrolase activator NlpD